MFDNYPEILTPDDVRKILKIGKNSIYKILKDEKLKSIRIGKNYRIPKKFLIEYIENPVYN